MSAATACCSGRMQVVCGRPCSRSVRPSSARGAAAAGPRPVQRQSSSALLTGQQGGQRRRVATAAGYDDAPVWTLDQSVGLVFGFLLLGLYLSSSTLDKWVARQQRRQLGLCEECGGMYEPGSCTQKNCPSKGKQQEQPPPAQQP